MSRFVVTKPAQTEEVKKLLRPAQGNGIDFGFAVLIEKRGGKLLISQGSTTLFLRSCSSGRRGLQKIVVGKPHASANRPFFVVERAVY
jgi:hypothetical protein